MLTNNGATVLTDREWRQIVQLFEQTSRTFVLSEVHRIADGVVLARESAPAGRNPRWFALWDVRVAQAIREETPRNEALHDRGVGVLHVGEAPALDLARRSALGLLRCSITEEALEQRAVHSIEY